MRYDGSAPPRGRQADEAPLGDPLRHHGDSETSAALADFAVNAFPGERPGWLDRALHAAIDQSAAYPDAAPAQAAIAGYHRVQRDVRARGVAVRRCDTFPGLDATWARIAVRPPAMTDRLLCELDRVRR